MNTASLTAGLRPWLALECLLVFFIAPLALDPLRHVLAFGVVPLVLILALITGLLLIRDRDFNRTILWSTRGLPQALRRIMPAFLLPATLLTVAAFFLREAHFLAFPRSRPTIWAVVILAYPLLAALPQEIFFRCFFFHRYRRLFPHPTPMIVASAMSFGLAHLLYANWVAPLLSFLGGFSLDGAT